MSFLKQEIKFLTGIGPKKAEILNKELNVFCNEDFLYLFPYRYIDKSKIYTISEIHPNLPYVQLKGKVFGFRYEGDQRKKRLIARFSDHTGTIELLWFQGHKWIQESIKQDVEYIIFGKPSVFGNKINILHPEIEEVSKRDVLINSTLQPQYSTTEKLKNNFITSRTLHKIIQTIFLKSIDEIKESMPDYLVERLRIMPLKEALQNIHFPVNADQLRLAEFRLKFEELFYIQLNLLKQKRNRKTSFKGFKFDKVGDAFNTFYYHHLPFELTGAQKKVLKEIRLDMNTGEQMNRLIQGDVGSGKTLVALMSMLIAIDNGYQTCIMAPTEILATQHFNSIQKFLGDMNINVRMLCGSTKKKQRSIISEELMNGQLNILVGTHALIEDHVQFKNLGLVIIDEQHRFGVEQRARLWQKNTNPPHVLVMTATPIPRTLAMTVYGDLDVSVIDELPPGRKPIVTAHYFDNKRLRLFAFMKEQIKIGRQVYVVYPLIQESEKMDYKDLEDGYESITRAFPPPEYQVSIVHGKMKAADKEISMQHFKKGLTNIMVATTVIEVGVDVPNATVMVIESAERFGLSQMHQLRGRVGRGGEQSYCILMTGHKLSDEARRRLEVMVKSNDGFEISEADLKLRGPGDIEGTQQSGIPFDLKIANLGRDGDILQQAREIAQKVIDKDPKLEYPENSVALKQLKKFSKGAVDWGLIS